MLIAAGVTFYALLALVPALTAFVSLYGIFADPATLDRHMDLLEGLIPSGGLDIVRDQLRRLAEQGHTKLGLTSLVAFAIALWRANFGGLADPQDRSTPALMADLLDQVTQLIRKEVQLFRAEMSDKATQAVVAAGSILAAAVVAITALNVLAAALVAALANAGIPAPWSAVIVGVGLAIIAFLMAKKGIDNLKAGSLAPERTTRAAVRDVSMVKEKI